LDLFLKYERKIRVCFESNRGLGRRKRRETTGAREIRKATLNYLN
jgi:hypothetical protein